MARESISILLPALNEETTIGKVIDELPAPVLRDKGYDVKIVVVDGRSKDRTVEISRKKGAEVILQPGYGKGNGVISALKSFDGAYMFMLDADYTYPAEHIKHMLPYLESGQYDILMGSRLSGAMAPGAMNPFNFLGNKFLTITANVLFPNGKKMSDVCTGMWGFRGEAIKKLKLESQRFDIEAEIYAKSVKRKFRIGELPIKYRKRVTRPKLKSIRDGLKIWLRLIIERIKR